MGAPSIGQNVDGTDGIEAAACGRPLFMMEVYDGLDEPWFCFPIIDRACLWFSMIGHSSRCCQPRVWGDSLG